MKRLGIIILGALAMLMAGCSKDITPSPSNDPDAWMYNETLPVPIRFSASTEPATKGAAINEAKDMEGKQFGFFAVSSQVTDWKEDTGLEMPQNALATCKLVEGTDDQVQFTFDQGPYYYPQTYADNFTFYGYHAIRAENYVRQSPDSLFVVVEVGKTDILWAKAKAEPSKAKVDDGNLYEGFNARYIRKTGNQPVMNFKHSTACVSFKAKTEYSDFATNNEGKDRITVTGVTVLKTVSAAVLRIAVKDDVTVDRNGKPIIQDEWEGSLRPTGFKDLSANDVKTEPLTDKAESLCSDFFLAPSETVTVRLDYTVDSGEMKTKSYSSTYTLAPEFTSEGTDMTGFHAGYKYNYNFIIYTPERIAIEATVEEYKSAFGKDGEGNDIFEDVKPDNE